MNLKINGKKVVLKQGVTVLDVLKFYKLKPESVVVEVNGEIVRKRNYETFVLNEGDVVEIIQVVGGG